ncbi:MAG: ABC transporter substrate-binding protein [Verrucomicrobiota bacterium]
MKRSAKRSGRHAGLRRGFVATVAILWAAAGSLAADRFPLSAHDDRGVAVRLDAAPRRVVSLAPNLTEIVFLLGKGDVLVGDTRFCDYPPAAALLPKVGGVTDPDVERVVALSPDLVLATMDGNPREKVRTLEELGIPCFAVAPQDLRAVLATIERVGALLGDASRGRAEAERLRHRADEVRAAARTERGPAPAVLFALSTTPLIAAGGGTFLDELVRLAGGRNAAGHLPGRYPRLAVEELVALRPDLILVAGMTGVERFPAEVTRWKEVPAFRDGAVITLDGDLVTRPGPRLVTGLEQIARAISGWRGRHGEGR